MNKLLLLLPFSLVPFFSTAQCANSANIYAFTFNGKNYEVVKELKTWSQAAACAVQRGGHLVHIDSLNEQNAVYNAITVGAGVPSNYVSVNDGGGAAYVWIGATDKNVEGTWLWDGDGDNVGTNFWNGQGAAGANNGAVVGNAFVNWGGAGQGTFNEPDNYNNVQDGGAIALSSWPYGVPGEWNDINPNNALYYVIEYENNSGFNEQGNDLHFDLFPNPAQNSVHFSIATNVKIQRIRILSVEGKTICEYSSLPNNDVDVSALTPGIYFLEIETGEHTFAHSRFIKL